MADPAPETGELIPSVTGKKRAREGSPGPLLHEASSLDTEAQQHEEDRRKRARREVEDKEKLPAIRLNATSLLFPVSAPTSEVKSTATDFTNARRLTRIPATGVVKLPNGDLITKKLLSVFRNMSEKGRTLNYSKEEMTAYEKALEVFGSSKKHNERVSALRAAKKKSSKSQAIENTGSLLNQSRHSIVSNALGLSESNESHEDKTMAMIENATQKVEDLFAQGATWPLPYQVQREISSGKTLFPRAVANGAFSKSFPGFDVGEVLKDGKPIKVTEFSCHGFLIAFLRANRSRWLHITEHLIFQLWDLYFDKYYGHSWMLAFGVKSTIRDPGVITLQEAKSKVQGLESEPQQSGGFTMMIGGETHAGSAVVHDAAPIKVNNTRSFDKGDGLVSQLHATGDADSGKELQPKSESVSELSSAKLSLACGNDLQLHDEEAHLQLRYFPVVSGSDLVAHCLICAATSHVSESCPTKKCSVCGESAGHPELLCPQQARCGKCRRIGHTTQLCPEKLFRASGEGLVCDICGHGHIEEKCDSDLVWRTLLLNPAENELVSGVLVYCYCCGSNGHLGPNCGLYQARPRKRRNNQPVNTSRFANSCQNDNSLPIRKNKSAAKTSKISFSIMGMADSPIMLDSSGDERPDVPPAKAPTFASETGADGVGHVARRRNKPRASRPIFDASNLSAASSYPHSNTPHQQGIDAMQSNGTRLRGGRTTAKRGPRAKRGKRLKH